MPEDDKPVVEQTTTSTQTTTASTDAAAKAVLSPSIVSRIDERVRAFIAVAFTTQFVFIICWSVITHTALQSDIFTVDVSITMAAIGVYVGGTIAAKSKDGH